MVVALRSWRMMHDSTAASREFERMVGEKMEVGVELAGALVTGEVLGIFGRRVRGNYRRLS